MKKLLASVLLLSSIATAALAQGGPGGGGPGPGPAPNPWVVSGPQISYGGCVVVPVGVAGGCKGNGTVNATAIYQGGFQVLGTLANGAMFVGNASAVGVAQIPSGDLTMSNVGAFTVNTYAGGTTFGTAAHANLGTAGATVPQNNTSNVFSLAQTVNLNGSALPAALNGTALRIGQANGTIARLEVDSFGASTPGILSIVYGRGTAAAPTAVQSGDEIGSFNSWGYTAAGTLSGTAVAAVRTYAAETFSSGHQGSQVCLASTQIAATSLINGMCLQAGVVVGAPTGGDKGVGAVNATGLYINNVAVTAAGITALIGDGSATGPGSVSFTLTTVNANVGTFGSSTAIPSITANGKGLITAVTTNVVIAPAGTLTGTTMASNVVTSSLTSVGTLAGGATGAGFTVALTTSTVTGNLPIANAPSIGANTVIGSIAGGTSAALTATQMTTIPNNFTTTLKGLVPPPGSVTGAVLSDAGTWIAVGGTGTVTSVAAGTGMSFATITGTGSVAVDVATSANFYGATANKMVDAATPYTAVPTPAFSATPTFDFGTSASFAPAAMTANITLMTCNNLKPNQGGFLKLTQDGTGGRTAVFCSAFKFAGGVAPILSTAPNAIDWITYTCQSSTVCAAAQLKNASWLYMPGVFRPRGMPSNDNAPLRMVG